MLGMSPCYHASEAVALVRRRAGSLRMSRIAPLSSALDVIRRLGERRRRPVVEPGDCAERGDHANLLLRADHGRICRLHGQPCMRMWSCSAKALLMSSTE